MKFWSLSTNFVLTAVMVTFVGCAEESTDDVGVPDDPSALSADEGSDADTSLGDAEPMVDTPEGVIALTPENTTIGFVGSHVVEEKPDPEARKGEFKKFTGTASVEGDQLKSISVEIVMESVSTGQEKLDNHLKDTDFFGVREHPTGSFKTTKIESADGKTMITGDLTLLDNTKSITFPATVSTEGGLKLDAEFEIDRTEFEINFDTSKVDKMVAMSIKIDA